MYAPNLTYSICLKALAGHSIGSCYKNGEIW